MISILFNDFSFPPFDELVLSPFTLFTLFTPVVLGEPFLFFSISAQHFQGNFVCESLSVPHFSFYAGTQSCIFLFLYFRFSSNVFMSMMSLHTTAQPINRSASRAFFVVVFFLVLSSNFGFFK